MAARLAASPGAGPVLPRPAKIRPNLDHSRCALSCPSMSLLDLSKWHGARSFWETRPLMPWTVGPRVYRRQWEDKKKSIDKDKKERSALTSKSTKERAARLE